MENLFILLGGVIAFLTGAVWRRLLGMRVDNRTYGRTIHFILGVILSYLVIGFPLFLVALPGLPSPWLVGAAIAAPLAWLSLPSAYSVYLIRPLIERAPWKWGALGSRFMWDLLEVGDAPPWLQNGDYPAPWAELLGGGLVWGICYTLAVGVALL